MDRRPTGPASALVGGTPVIWWCAATGLPWSWAWRAYPGVWAFIALIAGWYVRYGLPRTGRRAGAAKWFATGVLILWIGLDWPVGTLGGGYLASAHSLQLVLLAIAAPPFLLLGLRHRVVERLETRGPTPWLRSTAHPGTGLVVYNVILITTHFPHVVDGLMATQLGSLIVDLAWIGGGLALWWPVIAPPPLVRIKPPVQMAYLFVQTVPATFPAAFLTFSDYPLYRLYEFAPRAFAILTPSYDQQLAGLIMKAVGDPVVWLGIAVIFFRWATAERRADLADQSRLPGPATPR